MQPTREHKNVPHGRQVKEFALRCLSTMQHHYLYVFVLTCLVAASAKCNIRRRPWPTCSDMHSTLSWWRRIYGSSQFAWQSDWSIVEDHRLDGVLGCGELCAFCV